MSDYGCPAEGEKLLTISHAARQTGRRHDCDDHELPAFRRTAMSSATMLTAISGNCHGADFQADGGPHPIELFFRGQAGFQELFSHQGHLVPTADHGQIGQRPMDAYGQRLPASCRWPRVARTTKLS